MNPAATFNTGQPPPLRDGSHTAAQVTIPDHQLLRCIGRGSYGEVWLARHTMGMLRAVKVVYRASFQDERPFERELSGIRKFEPISRSYEGFLDILHVGINAQAGYFYYVMELGDDALSGETIDPEAYAPKTLTTEIAGKGRLSFPECIRLGLALSQALAELHRHNLVHRDIKPSNIVFVNGQPKLADIGLVAEIPEARSYVGTEGFIPPEGPGSPAADVYALGKVLYEICTGLDRKQFPSLPDWWDQSPEHPRLLELNEILIRACQTEQSARYQTAGELHSDLLILENGESVKRLRLLERRLASVKRAVGILAIAGVVLGLLGFELYREWRLRLESHQRQVGSDIAYANSAMEAGHLLEALPYFADALRLDQGDAVAEQNHRLRLGSSLVRCPRITQMWALSNKEIHTGQFSPDGRKVLLAEFYGQARVYDLASGKLLGQPFASPWLSDAAFSPDGRSIVTVGRGGSAAVWNADNLQQLRLIPHPCYVNTARFSPDGSRLVTSCEDGTARVWDARGSQAEPLLTLRRHTNAVIFAGYSHDGRLIITTGRDNKAYLWSAADGRPMGGPLEHKDWVSYAAFSPDDRTVATSSDDHQVKVWEVSSGKQIRPILNHEDVVQSVEFSPDGRLLATADLDGEVRLWTTETLQPWAACPVLRLGERVVHVDFSGDGHRLLVTCGDGSARTWDLASCSRLPTPALGSCCRDGSRFLTITNGEAQVWDALSGRPVCPGLKLEGLAREPELSATGQYLQTIHTEASAPGATNYLVQVWEVSTASARSPGILISNTPPKTALSSDGTRIFTFGVAQAQVWEVRTGRLLVTLPGAGNSLQAALFSPRANQLATRSGTQVQVWDLGTGRLAFPALEHLAYAWDMEFNPSGTLLATCCSDSVYTKCYAQLWNTTTGKPAGPQLNHGDGVLQVRFSADGSRLITSSEDFTAVVWDTATGRRLTPALRHRHQVQEASFSPDGHWVLTASLDSTARIWSAESGDPLTPPFRYPAPLYHGRFFPTGRHVFTAGTTDAWTTELHLDERPVQDLVLLANLLSGGTVNSGPRFTGARAEARQAVWEQLRAKYPADFTVSAEEVADWHEGQAQEAERARQWGAAAFHLEQLQLLHPGDASLAERLARARQHQ